MLHLIARLALPLALGVMVLAPAGGVLLTGRNLQSPSYLADAELPGIVLWYLRAMTLGVVALGAAAVLTHAMQRRNPPLQWRQLVFLLAFAGYFVTNVVAPGLLGAVPGLDKNFFYVLVVFAGVAMARSEGSEALQDAVKACILVFLLLSFVYAFANPDAALRTYKAELRLPLVPFRLWGLGPGPNSLAPLALTLVVGIIARPFASRPVQWLAMTAGLLTILLAQSQTTWISTAIIVPGLLAYRYLLARGVDVRMRVPQPVAVAGIGLAAAAVLVAVAFWMAEVRPETVVATPGVGSSSDDVLTGRGHIWRVALATLGANPLFGYGLTAWDTEFRNAIAMPYAFHAHNQLLQALSVGGVTGGAGLVLYALALVVGSLRVARVTGGLAPALAALALIGSVSETPLNMATLLLGDTVRHVLLFGLVMCGYGATTAALEPLEAARRMPAPRDTAERRGPLIA